MRQSGQSVATCEVEPEEFVGSADPLFAVTMVVSRSCHAPPPSACPMSPLVTPSTSSESTSASPLGTPVFPVRAVTQQSPGHYLQSRDPRARGADDARERIPHPVAHVVLPENPACLFEANQAADLAPLEGQRVQMSDSFQRLLFFSKRGLPFPLGAFPLGDVLPNANNPQGLTVGIEKAGRIPQKCSLATVSGDHRILVVLRLTTRESSPNFFSHRNADGLGEKLLDIVLSPDLSALPTVYLLGCPIPLENPEIPVEDHDHTPRR